MAENASKKNETLTNLNWTVNNAVTLCSKDRLENLLMGQAAWKTQVIYDVSKGSWIEQRYK